MSNTREVLLTLRSILNWRENNMAGSGVDTNKHQHIRLSLCAIERNMVDKLKRHYKFTSDRELVLALLKRATLNLKE